MKKFLVSSLAVTALAATAVLGAGGAANATTQWPEGGTWIYDATGTTNYSNYYHSSAKHRSSVSNRLGTVRSADAARGYWSYASQTVYTYGNNAYYYKY